VYYITPQEFGRQQITLFVIIETILFTLYLALMSQNDRLKKILLLILVGFVVFAISYAYISYEKDTYYATIASVETIIVIIACILVFFEQITHPQSLFIYSTDVFWIIAGILFYLSGIFFLSLVLPQLSDKETEKYWSLNLVFNILKNILFAIAFLMKNPTSNNSIFNKNLNT
jgi:predicted membrane channel-forming protein YqfA (hemolysin III family)